jgi:hypothetical protein
LNLIGIGQAQTQIMAAGVTELTFAPVNIDTTSAAQYSYIYNYGTSIVTFASTNAFVISGANAGDFAISQNECSTTVGPGGSCYIYFTFTPSVVGVESATVTITDTAGTQTISLFGTGVTPVSQVVLGQSSYNFGAVNVDTTASQSYVYIYNTGNTTVTLTSYSITGTDASEFSTGTTSCGTTLGAGGSCYIYFDFSPTATGQQVANLQFVDTAGTQIMSLYGTGQ